LRAIRSQYGPHGIHPMGWDTGLPLIMLGASWLGSSQWDYGQSDARPNSERRASSRPGGRLADRGMERLLEVDHELVGKAHDFIGLHILVFVSRSEPVGDVTAS